MSKAAKIVKKVLKAKRGMGEIAKLFGVSHTTISRWLSQNPSIKVRNLGNDKKKLLDFTLKNVAELKKLVKAKSAKK